MSAAPAAGLAVVASHLRDRPPVSTRFLLNDHALPCVQRVREVEALAERLLEPAPLVLRAVVVGA